MYLSNGRLCNSTTDKCNDKNVLHVSSVVCDLESGAALESITVVGVVLLFLGEFVKEGFIRGARHPDLLLRWQGTRNEERGTRKKEGMKISRCQGRINTEPVLKGYKVCMSL